MANLYSSLNRLSNLILPRSALNPKLAYTTIKAVWKRAKREVLGVPYSQDVKSVNIVVHDAKLLICGIPKVATTTFIQEFVYNKILGERVELHSAYLPDFLQKNPDLIEYHKVAFVRNPWSRVVSIYNSKICNPNPSFVRTFFIRYRGLSYGMPFDEFVHWLCETEEGGDSMADRHWVSQSLFLYKDGNLLVDHVAHIESMGEELLRLGSDIGREEIKLGNYSLKTTKGGGSYRDRYDDVLRDLVAKRYADDIQLFNYRF